VPLVRSARNPVLTRRQIPPFAPEMVDVSSVFNPGAATWRGHEVFLLRVQTRGRETALVPAERRGDGSFFVHSQTIAISGLERIDVTIHHLYDPRLTVLDDALYAICAADTDDGCRLMTMQADHLLRWRVVGFDRTGDRRNGVLFPARINGRFVRLQRPNQNQREGEPASGDEIWIAYSDDLDSWDSEKPVLRGRARFWDERIGAGPPPIRTRAGWLLMYHGVATHFGSCNIYQAGVCLLDLQDPSRMIARSSMNILEPRETYELLGQVPNVVFPSAAFVEEFDTDGFASESSRVRVYYGAADTVIALAETTVGELLEDCDGGGKSS
jgi:beta-1,4-mannooligosaccharide/beta-1,4-mannosyl-N-acetylglucosamine phosphorylase